MANKRIFTMKIVDSDSRMIQKINEQTHLIEKGL